MSTTPDGLRPGQRILQYELVEKLGEGGMGVVWKAIDTSLQRTVALKALPQGFSSDPERLARFEREARLLASITHPHIATVYSVHLVDQMRYLAMEWVPGEDLAKRLARGPIPVTEALELARQLAQALEAAHESGVVHRDLKPANICLTPDGRVKVLDFGLAKAMDTEARSPSLSASPTQAVSAMTSGMIIGTAAYMSPEQARGQSADRRADIWSFGVVLYEMLTGARAFDGETISDTLAAVLRAEPDRSRLPASLPVRIRTLLDRCFEKSARRRLRDIGEAVLVLEDVLAGRGAEVDAPSKPGPAPARASRLRIALPIVAAALALVVAVLGWLRPGPPPAALRKLTLSLQASAGELMHPALSPDGSKLAYVSGTELWLRNFRELTSRRLAQGLDVDFAPVWSPNGEALAFANDRGLCRADISTGAVRQLAAFSEFSGGSGGAWGRDGVIVFARGMDHLYEVPEGGGVATVRIERIDSTEADLHHPLLFPGRREVVCIIHTTGSGPSILAVAEPGKRRELLRVPSGLLWQLAYDPRGYLLFGRQGDGSGVWALPFSASQLRATGEPFFVAPEGASPSLGAHGELAYRLGVFGLEGTVVLIDRAGVVRDTVGPSALGLWSLHLAPDGRQLAVEVREGAEGDVEGYDLARGTRSRLAIGRGRQGEMAWSPDGSQYVYRDFTSSWILRVPSDGSHPPERVLVGTRPSYTADGKRLVYSRFGQGGQLDVWAASVADPSDSVALVLGPEDAGSPAAAPHAPYYAFESTESGNNEVYLQGYEPGGSRWQVSTNGGNLPRWSPSGDRLYYEYGNRFYEVSVRLEPTVSLGTPRMVFQMSDHRIRTFGRYSIVPTRDPNLFYAIQNSAAPAQSAADVVFVQDWLQEFAKRK